MEDKKLRVLAEFIKFLEKNEFEDGDGIMFDKDIEDGLETIKFKKMISYVGEIESCNRLVSIYKGRADIEVRKRLIRYLKEIKS